MGNPAVVFITYSINSSTSWATTNVSGHAANSTSSPFVELKSDLVPRSDQFSNGDYQVSDFDTVRTITTETTVNSSGGWSTLSAKNPATMPVRAPERPPPPSVATPEKKCRDTSRGGGSPKPLPRPKKRPLFRPCDAAARPSVGAALKPSWCHLRHGPIGLDAGAASKAGEHAGRAH